MDITSFFASIANNFRNHYLELSRQVEHYRAPADSRPKPTESEPIAQQPTVDQYEPTEKDIPEPTEPVTGTNDSPDEVPAPLEKPVEQYPDGTYYHRKAQLDYKLDLRFDLGAITRTAALLSEGEVKAIDEFAAAGFGFHAGFDLKGTQVVDTNANLDGSRGMRNHHAQTKARQAGRFAYASNNFALQAFYREAADVRQSLHESVHDTHRRTTNRFALRFRMDNQFNMQFANRFNVQTRQVAEQNPGVVGDYLNSVGEVAIKGSTELMSSFFDAVDGYLNDTEQKLVDSVSRFFDQAATELGFSGALVEQAREHLTGTINEFFDRVEVAVGDLKDTFVPSTEPSPTPLAELPPSLYDPATAEDQYELAVA